MGLPIHKFCEIVDGIIVQHANNFEINNINIYPISIYEYDTFFVIDSTKYSTSDCGFGNSGNEDSVFGLKGTQNTNLYISRNNHNVKTIVFDEENAITFQSGINYIKVKDSVDALGKYARYRIDNSHTKVIGITGSTGKSTLTKVIIELLSKNHSVQYTDFIRITYVGLIWFIIHCLQEDTEWLVIEMQIDGIGQIDRLCKIVSLDVAFIININNAHLERFHSTNCILFEKLGVYRGLKKDGCLFINAANDILNKWGCEINDNRVILVEPNKQLLEIIHDYQHIDTMSLLAAFNTLVNGNEKKYLLKTITENRPIIGRFQLFSGINGAIVIVDTYNASYESTIFGIHYLSEHKRKHKVLILGQLLELGEESEETHRIIGKYLNQENRINNVILFGEATLYVMDELKRDSINCKHVYTYDGALKYINNMSLSNDTIIYIKGSGSNRLEILAMQLISKTIVE